MKTFQIGNLVEMAVNLHSGEIISKLRSFGKRGQDASYCVFEISGFAQRYFRMPLKSDVIPECVCHFPSQSLNAEESSGTWKTVNIFGGSSRLVAKLQR